jgi:hypothetical protein
MLGRLSSQLKLFPLYPGRGGEQIDDQAQDSWLRLPYRKVETL